MSDISPAMEDLQGRELFSLFGQLKVTLGSIDERLRQQHERDQRARQHETPRFVPIAGTVVLDANGFGVVKLNCSSPAQGHMWHVRKLAIGGLTTTTAVAGRADIFVSAMGFAQITATSVPGLSDWADQATSLPQIAFYGAGEMMLRASEVLHILISGGSVGQQIVTAGMVEDFEESSALLNGWGI